MKIIKEPWVEPPAVSLSEFADQHGLVMRVTERPPENAAPSARWYARFDGVEVKEGRVLVGTFGNGYDPESAIADYAGNIAGELLVTDPNGSRRREIRAPKRWREEAT